LEKSGKGAIMLVGPGPQGRGRRVGKKQHKVGTEVLIGNHKKDDLSVPEGGQNSEG